MVRTRIIAVLATAVAVSAAPRVVQYRAQIRSADHRTYNVDISIATSGEAWSTPSFTLDGEVLDRIAPGDPSRFHYSVNIVASRVRIPLAVPEIPSSGLPRSVEIKLIPPPGYVIAGDMFPAFERRGSGEFVAQLANIPGHLEFEIARADQTSFRQRWLTPAVFSDSAVILFLLLGSVARFLLRKPEDT